MKPGALQIAVRSALRSRNIAVILLVAVVTIPMLMGFIKANNIVFFFSTALLSSLVWFIKPISGLALAIVLSFFDLRTQLGHINLRLYEVVTLIVTVPTILSVGIRHWRDFPLKAFLPFLVYAFATALLSISFGKTIIYSLRIFVLLLFVFHAYQIVTTNLRMNNRSILLVMSFGVAVIALQGYIQMLWGKSFLDLLKDGWYVPFMSGESLFRAEGSWYFGHRGQLRPFSFFASPHMHTAILSMGSIFLLSVRGHYFFPRIVGILGLLQVILGDVGGSRLGLLGAGFFLLFFLLNRRFKMTSLALLGGVAIFIIILRYQVIAILQDVIDWHRLQLWAIGWKTFFSSPIYGVGAGTAMLIIEDHASSLLYWFDHFHNWYLELLACTGIIGLGLFLNFVVRLYRTYLRHYPWAPGQSLGGMLILTYYLSHNLVDSFDLGGNIVLLFFLLLTTFSAVVDVQIAKGGHFRMANARR